jgi:hypothetical protein
MPPPRLTDEKEKGEVLEFDTFTVAHGPVLPVLHEDRFISKVGRRSGPVYRQSLPTDAELLQMRDISSVTNFLGWNPFETKLTNGMFKPAAEEPGIRFFALRPYNSIEILHVTFLKRASEATTIDGVLAKRALLHPEAKNQ